MFYFREFSDVLTEAQLTVLSVWWENPHWRRRDLAKHLCVSEDTIKTHLRGIYQALDVYCDRAAFKRALEMGLLSCVGPNWHPTPMALVASEAIEAIDAKTEDASQGSDTSSPSGTSGS